MTKTFEWEIVFSAHAEKEFAKLDRQAQKEITKYLSTRVLEAENPRVLGKALKGNLSDAWSYRVGNYRIICKIEDSELVVVVVRVAHRKEVYLHH